MEECIARHKNNEATTARCPNCVKNHHEWHPSAPKGFAEYPDRANNINSSLRHNQGGEDDVTLKHSKGNPNSSQLKLSNSRVTAGMHHVASGSSSRIHHVTSQEGFPMHLPHLQSG